jgi:hypothetical protein
MAVLVSLGLQLSKCPQAHIVPKVYDCIITFGLEVTPKVKRERDQTDWW